MRGSPRHAVGAAGSPTGPVQIALIGNPNAGKTTLFNALTGLRAKTANFPGTTIERRIGRAQFGGQSVQLLDLPGLYSVAGLTAEERVARDALTGALPGQTKPDVVLLLIDATNLERNLYLASQVLELGVPTVVALNMVDLAEKASIEIDAEQLSRELGCPVVPIVARDGRGITELAAEVSAVVHTRVVPRPLQAVPSAEACAGCAFKARYDWADDVGTRCSGGRPVTHGRRTDRIDRVLTHPWVGVAAFLTVMFVVFALIFWVADYPMGWIEGGFAAAGDALGAVLPDGYAKSLLVEGVIGGVGGVLVFLPQICILFFFLSLLEDTGYLARAAFVMDRLMRRVGLPGKAFVPMISAHACAIPAIMSTRVIDDRRDRLVTMLVLPLFSCSARIPVYAILTALLFPGQPTQAALAFTAAYTLGIVAALGMAFMFKRTILKGESRPLVLELPGYKLPSLKNALLATWDRARIFVRRAGTVILVVSIVLWALATFPESAPPADAAALLDQAAEAAAAGDAATAEELTASAERRIAQSGLANSFAGRVGRLIEPVIAPLGFDWQIGVGILSSFAAREVIVSTLAVVYGVGESAAEDEPRTLTDTLATATRSDGSLVYTTATSASLLVFYVLAMQCLSTQAITRRETGGWRWPLVQLGYMSVLAYVASLLTFQGLTYLGFG